METAQVNRRGFQADETSSRKLKSFKDCVRGFDDLRFFIGHTDE